MATTTLYRPVGQPELELIAANDWRRFPPRLDWQPIFYPVTNEPYATRIAREWNTKDDENGNVGYVLRFNVETASSRSLMSSRWAMRSASNTGSRLRSSTPSTITSSARSRSSRSGGLKMANDRNWAHQPDFDPAAMAEFERRLSRARAPNRPGYLRVKAATLLQQQDAAAVPVAIDLLRRVVTGSDHFLEVPFSHELLGRAYRRSGDLAAAETHLRLAIETADDHRNGLGLPELELAEVTLEAGKQEDATAALQAVEQLERGMVWDSQLYRHAVTKARLAHLGGGDAARWATRALELAAETQPQLTRHPTVGLVDAPPEELREMKRLAKPKTKPRWRRA